MRLASRRRAAVHEQPLHATLSRTIRHPAADRERLVRGQRDLPADVEQPRQARVDPGGPDALISRVPDYSAATSDSRRLRRASLRGINVDPLKNSIFLLRTYWTR